MVGPSSRSSEQTLWPLPCLHPRSVAKLSQDGTLTNMTSSVASAATLDHTAGVGDPEPALSVAEAAARVGLTAATLRTWHRRYGLGTQ